MRRLTRKRAFELGAIAANYLARAKCGNLTEGLMEDMMTSGGLTKADKVAMTHQVNAINAVEKDIENSTWKAAAYYGSYILNERETQEIKVLFPDVSQKWARREAKEKQQ